jgi:hypothetical protein
MFAPYNGTETKQRAALGRPFLLRGTVGSQCRQTEKPMKIADAVASKYQLKWLHEEIDLYDRKIAHLDKYSATASASDRARMVTKRSTLEKAARKLAAEGVEFDSKTLPRSFRVQPAAVSEIAETD